MFRTPCDYSDKANFFCSDLCTLHKVLFGTGFCLLHHHPLCYPRKATSCFHYISSGCLWIVLKFSIHFACILHLGKHVKIDLEYQWAWYLYWKVWMNFGKVYLCLTKHSGIFKNSKCLYCSVSFSVLCDIWPNWWIKLAWNNHCTCSIAFCPAFLSLLADFCFSIIVLALCPCAACCKANHWSYCFMTVFTWHMHGHSGRCCCCCIT